MSRNPEKGLSISGLLKKGSVDPGRKCFMGDVKPKVRLERQGETMAMSKFKGMSREGVSLMKSGFQE